MNQAACPLRLKRLYAEAFPQNGGDEMTDRLFLWWIHERLQRVHGESEFVDYMHHLRAIIADMPPDKSTPDVARVDTAADVLRRLLTPNTN
jgi:hypothetical protein